jgi:hypothetical protein
VGAVANVRIEALGAIFKAKGPSDAWEDGYKGWVSEDFIKRREAAAKALGAEDIKGITHVKPETAEGYLQAAQELVADKDRRPHLMIEHDGHPIVKPTAQELAEYAIAEQLYLERVDWSVPGTAQIADAAQAMALNTSHSHQSPKNVQKHQ